MPLAGTTMQSSSTATFITIEANAFVTSLQLTIQAFCQEEGSLKIYDELGQAVYRIVLSLQPGANHKEISIASLPPGTYYIHFRTSQTRAFMINKIEKTADAK